ncbi:Hypothetical protein CINCED_3A009016 [Cinara cedri]|uniref:Uncharacterized protein n=1 Tax=Cinara cedri TaxID=506608 RepID=A0A5E4MQ32_9HEMI|nr:Hypothetical protein CINCED_3A009016 [Cinara cedri]
MESDDDYYTVSECLSSKVSSYDSCTPVASDQDEECYDNADTVVRREVSQTRRLMLSPVRGCAETTESVYKDIVTPAPPRSTDKRPEVSEQFIFKIPRPPAARRRRP